MSVNNKALMTNAVLLYGCAYGLDTACTTRACEDGPVQCLTADQVLIMRNCIGHGWYTKLQSGSLLMTGKGGKKKEIRIPDGIECTQPRLDIEYQMMVSSCVKDRLTLPEHGLKQPFPGARNKVYALEELTDLLPMIATINGNATLGVRTVETLAWLLVGDPSGKYAEMILSSLVRRAIEEYREKTTLADTMLWEKSLFSRVSHILDDGKLALFDDAYRKSVYDFAHNVEVYSIDTTGFTKTCLITMARIANRQVEDLSNGVQSGLLAAATTSSQVSEVSCSWLYELYLTLLDMGGCAPSRYLEAFANRRLSKCEDHAGYRTVLELTRSMVSDERLAKTKGGGLVKSRLDALGKFMCNKDNVDDDEEIKCLKVTWASLK